MDPTLSTDRRERMRATAMQTAGVQHPGIVELHDFGWHGDGAYAVTAFVEGETLAQYLARAGRLPALQGLSLSVQLLAALAPAHERGLVHSALNPQHVLIGRNGQLKIAGFGWLGAAASASRRPGVFDVPAYMAPEQILGQPADCRADLYSAAVVAYELLTGSWPYQAHAAPRPARELRRELPAALDAVFERAQARNPEARHHNAAELAAALQTAFGMHVEERAVVPVRPQRAVQARAPAPPTAPKELGEPAAVRHRCAGAALVAGLAAALVVGGMFVGVGVESMRAPLGAPGQRAAPAPAAAAATSPSPAPSPLAAAPAPPPDLPAAHAVPATASIEAPKAAQALANLRPVRGAAPVPATGRPAEPRPRKAVEPPVERGVREIVVAEPIEVPPRQAAAQPPPPPAPAPRPRETVERPAPQRTAATEPPEPSSRATAAMAAPPSPSPLNVCRQDYSIARELCVAYECASSEYRHHPVCVRIHADAVVRHRLNQRNGP
ncbi:serine/threonine protein kinase [Ramlibacter henchirensis]|uniref:Serine/threonine protein kinase n=1 Tax=Ramlibacter henchirensis TaxID=204072 RepID=A0A4Z0BRH5_9BURK|nr:serine/threonine protein kinase [Ramlibacter henchirensis]